MISVSVPVYMDRRARNRITELSTRVGKVCLKV